MKGLRMAWATTAAADTVAVGWGEAQRLGGGGAQWILEQEGHRRRAGFRNIILVAVDEGGRKNLAFGVSYQENFCSLQIVPKKSMSTQL